MCGRGECEASADTGAQNVRRYKKSLSHRRSAEQMGRRLHSNAVLSRTYGRSTAHGFAAVAHRTPYMQQWQHRAHTTPVRAPRSPFPSPSTPTSPSGLSTGLISLERALSGRMLSSSSTTRACGHEASDSRKRSLKRATTSWWDSVRKRAWTSLRRKNGDDDRRRPGTDAVTISHAREKTRTGKPGSAHAASRQ